MSDALAQLCKLLRECGATLTLYGKPVSEDELRAHVESSVDERLTSLLKKRKASR